MKNWSRGAKVLALTSIGVMLVSLDISIVNVAFGSFVAEWPESRRTLTWIFSAYNIAYAAGLLTAGRLADAFGRKRAFLTGLMIFMLGSILCAVSPTAIFMVIARIIQAIGGAILTPASLALVLPEFAVEKRSAAIGIWGAVGGISAASGPTIGGFLVDTFGWHSVFLVNVPFCLLAFAIGLKLLRESRDETAPRTVDYFGALLVVLGVGLLTLMIVQSDEWGWVSNRSLTIFAISLLFIAAFVWRCNKVAHPVLDLRLFRLPFVTAAAISGFVFTMGFFSMIFVNTQWLQVVWGYSPSLSGLAGSPGPLAAAIVAAPAGKLANRIGHGKVVATGALIMSIGIAWMNLFISTEIHYWDFYFPTMVVTGIGVGLCISTISSSATAFLPQPKFAMGSALNNTSRQIGAALGVALVSSMLVAAAKTDTPTNGFHAAWTLMSGVILLSGIAMLTLFRRPTAEQLAQAS
ncbi:MAG: DHA2 family efflux MFS transporter permease subunit [Actinobacteria bacterium]|nr:DHA2 family efflux MFS transporter permease subunit [Actinomycetota bacterium]